MTVESVAVWAPNLLMGLLSRNKDAARSGEYEADSANNVVRAVCVENDITKSISALNSGNALTVYGGKSLAVWAMLYRNESVLKAIVNAGGDLDKTTDAAVGDGNILMSAMNDRAPKRIVEYMLRTSCKEDLLSSPNTYGWTAMEFAILSRSHVRDTLLHERLKKARPDDTLHFFLAIADNRVADARDFLSDNAVSETDLSKALWMSRSVSSRCLLLEYGANMHTKNPFGDTFLFSGPFLTNIATDLSSMELLKRTCPSDYIVRRAVKEGFLNDRNAVGMTALCHAIAHQRPHTVFALLHAGADPMVACDGLDAFDLAHGVYRSDVVISMLDSHMLRTAATTPTKSKDEVPTRVQFWNYIHRNQTKAVLGWISSNGKGNSTLLSAALVVAIRNHALELVRVLISKGASGCKSVLGTTALFCAIESGDSDIADCVVASAGKALNEVNTQGHIMPYVRKQAIFSKLVDRGCWLGGVDRQGKNILHRLFEGRNQLEDGILHNVLKISDPSLLLNEDKWGWCPADIALSETSLAEDMRRHVASVCNDRREVIWTLLLEETYLRDDNVMRDLKNFESRQKIKNLGKVLAFAASNARLGIIKFLMPYISQATEDIFHFDGHHVFEFIRDVPGFDHVVVRGMLSGILDPSMSVGEDSLFHTVLKTHGAPSGFHVGVLALADEYPALKTKEFACIRGKSHNLFTFGLEYSVQAILEYIVSSGADWNAIHGDFSLWEWALMYHADSILNLINDPDTETSSQVEIARNILKAARLKRWSSELKKAILRLEGRFSVFARQLVAMQNHFCPWLWEVVKVDDMMTVFTMDFMSPAVLTEILKTKTPYEVKNLVYHHVRSAVDLPSILKQGHVVSYQDIETVRGSGNKASLEAISSFDCVVAQTSCWDNRVVLHSAVDQKVMNGETPADPDYMLLSTAFKEGSIRELPGQHHAEDFFFVWAIEEENTTFIDSMLDAGYRPTSRILDHGGWPPTILAHLVRSEHQLFEGLSVTNITHRIKEAVESLDVFDSLLDFTVSKKIELTKSDYYDIATAAIEQVLDDDDKDFGVLKSLLERNVVDLTFWKQTGWPVIDRIRIENDIHLNEMLRRSSGDAKAKEIMQIWDTVTQPTQYSQREIREYGKSPDVSPELMGRLLHFALAYSPGLAATLLSVGASVSVKKPNGETTDQVCVRHQRIHLYPEILQALEGDLSIDAWIRVVETAVSKPPFLRVALKQLGARANVVLSVGLASILQYKFGPESLNIMVSNGMNPKQHCGETPFLSRLIEGGLGPGMKGTLEAAVNAGADPSLLVDSHIIEDGLLYGVEADEIGCLVPDAEQIDLAVRMRNRFGVGIFFTLASLADVEGFGDILTKSKKFEAIVKRFEEAPKQFASCLQARNFSGETPIHQVLKSIIGLNDKHNIDEDPNYDVKIEYLNKALDTYGHAVDSYLDDPEEFLTVGDASGETLLSLGVRAKAYDFLSLTSVADYVDNNMWQKFVKKDFIKEAAVYYMFVFLYTAVCIFEHRRGHVFYTTNEDWIAFVLQMGVLLLGIWLLRSEITEFQLRGKKDIPVSKLVTIFSVVIPRKLKTWIEKRERVVSVPEYLIDRSNILDGGMLLVLFTSAVVRFILVVSAYDQPTHFERIVFAINGIVIWIRCLNYSRQTERLGPLLHMIEEMVRDVFNFMLLFLVFLFGFATAFFWINYSEGSSAGLEQFDNFYETLMWLLEVFFGNFEFSDHENENVAVNRLLYISYLILAFILLLNLLIAMLSSSYARIEEKAVTQFNLDRVELCIKYEKLNTSSLERKHNMERQHSLCTQVTRDLHSAYQKVLERQRDRQNFTVARINEKSIEEKLQDAHEMTTHLREKMTTRWSS